MLTIQVKFHGPTNCRGSRYTARDDRNSATVSHDYALDNKRNAERAFLALCKKRGVGGKYVIGQTDNGPYYFTFLSGSDWDTGDTHNEDTI